MPKDIQSNLYEGWTAKTYAQFEEYFTPQDKEKCWIWGGDYSRSFKNDGTETLSPVFKASQHTSSRSAALLVYDQIIGLPEEAKGKYAKTFRQCNECLCVNPYHRALKLFKLPNKKLGPKPRKEKKKQSTCIRGHDVSFVGARNKDGSCKKCKKILNKEYQEKRERKAPEDWTTKAAALLDTF